MICVKKIWYLCNDTNTIIGDDFNRFYISSAQDKYSKEQYKEAFGWRLCSLPVNLHFLILYTGYIYTEVTHMIYVRRGTTSAVYFIYKSRAFMAEPVNKLEKQGTEKAKFHKNNNKR